MEVCKIPFAHQQKKTLSPQVLTVTWHFPRRQRGGHTAALGHHSVLIGRYVKCTAYPNTKPNIANAGDRVLDQDHPLSLGRSLHGLTRAGHGWLPPAPTPPG
jgi:hypothetical protein